MADDTSTLEGLPERECIELLGPHLGRRRPPGTSRSRAVPIQYELGEPGSLVGTFRRGTKGLTYDMTTFIAVAAFVVVYLLIATERIPRVPAALGGTAIVLGTGVVHSHDAFFSEETGVDWNVIFLLLGMMVIVGVIHRTGLFEYLGIKSVKVTKARPLRLMMLLVLITAVGSALLDNVTTVLLIAPITLAVCERLGVRPVPYLLAEVFASNIGGAATLIGDPPNIIIASRASLTFNDFLVHMAPLVVVAMAVFMVMLRWLFRDAFAVDMGRSAEVLAFDEHATIRDAGLLVKSLVVLGLVLIGFLLRPVMHLEPSVVALIGAGVLVMASKLSFAQCVEGVEWATLGFFMGLFIMVGALVKVGVIDDLASIAADGTHGRLRFGAIALLVVSAVVSGVVDNIPYVAAMSPLVAKVVVDANGAHGADALWWVLAIGAGFGGNATAVGASANVVMLGIAKKAGHPISFWEFTRKGVIVTAATIAVALPYVWLRYFY